MSFLYFAYGSNLWPPQMRSRCPSAAAVGTAAIEGWRLVYDKPSSDGSAKLNIRRDPTGRVEGMVYQIEDGERQALDEAEPLYTPIEIDLDGAPAITYHYQGEPTYAAPYDWYVAVARLGAASLGLDEEPFRVDPAPDPIAPGLRPWTADDLGTVQRILSDGLVESGDRYYIHPGDFAWWIYHDDPRHPDHFSTWVQGDAGFITIDSLSPCEINVFTRPGIDRMPLVRWAQRRLGGEGDVGWVSDADVEMTEALESDGYRPVQTYRTYRWDLTGDIPTPETPPGWSLRPVAGEDEANTRRAASHAAFESTMPSAMHLERYLRFMRSPVYVPDRDLVAVSPEGRVGSFMIWWGDGSGLAQIEPFGTHPDFQRHGIGRALIYHGLARMRDTGMHTARVVTDGSRDATAFYEDVGFGGTATLRWWRKLYRAANG